MVEPISVQSPQPGKLKTMDTLKVPVMSRVPVNLARNVAVVPLPFMLMDGAVVITGEEELLVV